MKDKVKASAPVPEKAQEEAESGVSHARKAAEDFKSARRRGGGSVPRPGREVWNDARGRARTFQEDSEQYVRDNPTKAVFSALAIGFVLGLIFRR